MGEILRVMGQAYLAAFKAIAVVALGSAVAFIWVGPAFIAGWAAASGDWDKATFFLALQLVLWFALSRE